jgi:hypothetical protein
LERIQENSQSLGAGPNQRKNYQMLSNEYHYKKQWKCYNY